MCIPILNIHEFVMNFKKIQKVRTLLDGMHYYHMAESAKQQSPRVFDNWGQVSVSIEDLAVRKNECTSG